MREQKQKPAFNIGSIIKRNGVVAAFDRSKISDSIFRAAVEVGGSNRQIAESLTDNCLDIINKAYSPQSLPSVEEIQDIIEKVLVEKGHYKTAKAYILYRAEHARLREQKESRIIAEDNIPYKTLWQVYSWNVDHSCDTVEKINACLKNGAFPKLVRQSEKKYHDDIAKVVERIFRDRDKIRIIIVAGPSSSGKTTTTLKIGEELQREGVHFKALNVDNYFKDIESHPKDEYGDYDYETPQALDLELINEHLHGLINGKKVLLPKYNFKTGKRTLNSEEFSLEKNEILLIDSLHGLYPEMTSSVPHEMKFKFYIESLAQIKDAAGEFVRWTDLRMIRRMVRDSWHRSYNPEMTVGHWHYVRKSELRHIVPFINKVDYVFNGALSYELPVYKPLLFNLLPSIISKYDSDPARLDAAIRARRVYKLLESVDELKDNSCIPKNSLIREFIGSSSYEY